jgi:hypothetical protein
MEHALNNAPELASFRTPFPDDPSLIYTHSQGGIRTAIQFALRGARRILGRIGPGASPISQDSIVDGIAYAAEHPDRIAPGRFVHFVGDLASYLFGRYLPRALAIRMGTLDWWEETWGKLGMPTRTRRWCKGWIRNDGWKLAGRGYRG